MPADNESVLLPEPPPPRLTARDAAIEAAMRRFDGVADPPKAAPARRPSSWIRKPQFGLAMAASLILVVGLPATFIGLRDHESETATRTAPEARSPTGSAAPSMRFAPAPEANVVQIQPKPEAPAPVEPPRALRPQAPAMNSPVQVAPMAEREASAERDEIAPVAAAPPPPPPPPPAPPPPAPSVAQKSTAEGQDLIVTGSRITRPNLEDSSGFNSLPRKAEPAAQTYARFLGDLQSAVRSDDREAVVKLIRFPLRVNKGGKSRFYRDAQSVRVDYDRIFTPRVTEAILAQRADRLFSRDQGTMIGDGQVWFDHVCLNSNCSSLGPVRIIAVNP